MKKLIVFIVALGLVAGSYWLSRQYFDGEEAEAEFRPPRLPARVEVAVAQRQPLRETITYPGSVAADETVTIAPRISGIITAIHVDFGEYVNIGDPLVYIDDAEYNERLKQAQANQQLSEAQLRRSQTQHDLAIRDYDRIRSLAKEGVSMLQQVDTALAARDSAAAEVEVARAEVARMQAMVEEAQLNLADTKIRSPLAGWVQARHADPGVLATSSSPILTIVDSDPAAVVVFVPESELGLASVGREALVVLRDENANVEGKVARVAPSLSISTRTTEVVIDVPNPEGALRPGMSADVTLVAREDANALVVPAPALVFQNGRMEVYRVVDGKALAVPVEVGIEQEGLVQIVSGLNDGDRVIVKGQYMVRDGDEVNDGTGAQVPSKHPGGDS